MKRISTNMNNLRQSLKTFWKRDSYCSLSRYRDPWHRATHVDRRGLRSHAVEDGYLKLFVLCSWIDVCAHLNGSLSALPVPTAVKPLLNPYIHYKITVGTMLHQKHKIAQVCLSAQRASKQQQAATVVSHQSHYSDTHCTWIYFNLDSKAIWQPLSSAQRSTCLERLWGITTSAVTQSTWANQYRPGGK